jgi:hypothetical protein
MPESHGPNPHDEPVTEDRPVLLGSKYNATAPAVADGDAVWLLVDASGSPLVSGNVAHDAVDSGNPVKIGLKYTAVPVPVADGDRVDALGSPEGATIVSFQSANGNISDGATQSTRYMLDDAGNSSLLPTAILGLAPDTRKDFFRTLGDTAGAGLGVLAAAPWIPGASDVKSKTVVVGATSVTRATVITPTSGKKIRVVSVSLANKSTTAPDKVGVYFGTGAAYLTNPTTVVGEYFIGATGNGGQEWPDGGGPVGAVDAVLSWITETETEVGLDITVQYREE